MSSPINLSDHQNIFFIGIAGVGMSALAQYLKGCGKNVSGSDRYFDPSTANETRQKLENEGISCFLQNGSGITDNTDLAVVSTAIEDTVAEVKIARERHIPIIKRSDLLALICETRKTIAVAGTSGKSTTAALLFQILEHAGYSPGIISGAGLTALIEKGKIGNAAVGGGEYLVIEADESDGSVTKYHPEIGVLLNVDKDHQTIEELMDLFKTFKTNTKSLFVVNQSNTLSKSLSENISSDFGFETECGYNVQDYVQNGFEMSFDVNGQNFGMTALGQYSAENAAAAIAVANQIGVPLQKCADALRTYKGIYRRQQVLGKKNEILVIDDYAHNPAKCAAAIRACHQISAKVVAWFQPHGYGPTKFLKDDFVREIADALRAEDEMWMSEIYYAGGTAVKDISAGDLVNGIKGRGKQAFFVENRQDFLGHVRPHLAPGSILLLMGARDPGLEKFCKDLYNQL